MAKDKQLKKAEFYKKFFPRKLPKMNPAKLKFVAKMIEKKFLEGDELYCLPGDGVIPIGEKIEKPPDMVLPSRVVEHFIEKASFRFILDVCICREAMPCQNYPIDIGCIFLGEAARGIHPGLGREVSKEEALDHARRAREAGLIHSVGKSKLDTVWLQIGPGEKLFTICNCCPCCCITRGLPFSHPLLGENYSRMPGVRVRVTDECQGCGTCVEEGVCIFGGIRMEGDRAVIGDQCRGCGRCVSVCPNQVIEVVIEDQGYVQQTIDRLSKKIDVT